MNFLPCNSRIPENRSQYFLSVKEIPDEIFTDLKCLNNLYFNPKYLEALEKSNKQIQFAYIVVYNGAAKAVGLCIIQIIDFLLDSFQDENTSLFEHIKCIGRKFRILPSGRPLKILTSGNTFVTGEHGMYICSEEDKKKVLKQFVMALFDFVEENQILKEEIDAFMIKDFLEESLLITNDLKQEGYYPFKVEPNMVMTLPESWNSFNDYLAAMKTKFRVKAKKALKQSAEIQIKDISLDQLDDLLPQMTELYKKVSGNAGFNLGEFNLETYKTLKENLKERYILKGYWLEEKLLGFMSGIINEGSLDAHFVGINYEVNRQYAVYQRMLYDYVDLGIQNKVKHINFGRTASEIKSSIGAVPQEMTIYLRHRKRLPNKLLRLFLNRIKPTEFQQKFPFKELNEEG